MEYDLSFRHRIPKRQNLCPYMRLIVWSLLTLPIRWLWRRAYYSDHDVAWRTIFVLGWIAIAEIIAVLVVPLPNFALYVAGADASVAAFVGILFGVAFADVLYKRYRKEHPKSEPQPVKPKEPSLVKTWVRAQHTKVCPIIEFDENA